MRSETATRMMSELTSRGYHPSGGSWEDDRHICVFSRETAGPATYNATEALLMHDKTTGKTTFRNRQIDLPEMPSHVPADWPDVHRLVK